jgi:hypothetical protein
MLLHTCWRAPRALARWRGPQLPPAGSGHPTAHRRLARAASAAATEAPSADLIDWPEGLKPKRGGITRAALLRLKVSATPARSGPHAMHLRPAERPGQELHLLGCAAWRRTFAPPQQA